jgi:hypothetical protein
MRGSKRSVDDTVVLNFVCLYNIDPFSHGNR